MLREPLVEKCVVRRQQINNVAIFTHDALEKHLRFGAEILAQFIVPVWIELPVGRSDRQIPQVENLIGEVIYESSRSRIGKHAACLLLEHNGIAEPLLCCKSDQLLVGNAAP